MARPLNLLVVEDRPDDAELVLAQLRLAGFEPRWRRVDSEPDYAAALSPDLDLILANYRVSGFDAPRALQLLRDRGVDVPLIIVSGLGDEETAVTAMKAGASDFIPKDRLGRLAATVERELRAATERKSARREREAAQAELQRLAAIIENSNDAIFGLDLDWKITSWNHGAEALYGYSAKEAIGQPVQMLVPDEFQDPSSEYSAKLLAGAAVAPFETVRLHKSGRRIDVSIAVSPLRDQAGRLIGRSAIVREISERNLIERRKAQQDLLERTRLYEALVSAQTELGQILILTDGQTPIYINDAFVRLTGYSREELARLDSLLDLVSPDRQLPLPANLVERMGSERTRNFDTEIVAKDGHRIELEGTDLRFEVGDRTLVFTVAHDVTERKAAQRALEQQLTHDTLTGLANRRLLRDWIEDLATGTKSPFSVAILGLDHFREVNDTFGHHAGDVILQQVASRLTTILGSDRAVARLAGDTFAALLPRLDRLAAAAQAIRLLSAMDEPFEVEGQTLDLGASAGVATFPQDGVRADELLRHADIALSAAKLSRGSCVSYQPDLDRRGASRLALMAELRKAIQDDRIFIHFQPVVSLRTNELIRFEALVRWRDANGSVIPPAEFVPFAEKTRLIRPLTRRVIERSLRQWRRWHDAGHQLQVAVNISMRDLLDPAFPDEIAKLVQAAGADPTALILEITEGGIMSEPERVLGILGRLKRLGLRLAVDDFGTGYSSLAYLHRLPVDEIKIDRSFISSMSGAVSKSSIVRAAVDLGHSLRLEAVAEGIEDSQTWDLLGALGCDLGQGFYVSRPMSAADADRWMDRWNERALEAA